MKKVIKPAPKAEGWVNNPMLELNRILLRRTILLTPRELRAILKLKQEWQKQAQQEVIEEVEEWVEENYDCADDLQNFLSNLKKRK